MVKSDNLDAASGIKIIAFDHGSALSGVAASQALAWSSSMSFMDTNQNGNLDPGEAQGPFVVAASISRGPAPSTWSLTPR